MFAQVPVRHAADWHSSASSSSRCPRLSRPLQILGLPPCARTALSSTALLLVVPTLPRAFELALPLPGTFSPGVPADCPLLIPTPRPCSGTWVLSPAPRALLPLTLLCEAPPPSSLSSHQCWPHAGAGLPLPEQVGVECATRGSQAI